jgi:hypothetical protein
MKRAKRIEAILSVVVCLALVFYGLYVLRDLREIGPIVPDSQRGYSINSCDWLCQILIGYVITKVADWAINQTSSANNNCNGPCGGGGGGGLAADDGCSADSSEICYRPRD